MRPRSLRDQIVLADQRQRDLDAFDRAIHRPPRSYADEVGRHIHASRRGQRGYVLAHHGLLLGSGGGAGGPTDPSFANVSLLLPLTGADTGTTWTDASSYGHTITRLQSNTVTTTSTAQAKWGASSTQSTSAAGGLLTSIQNSTALEFQFDGDFTQELWVRFASSAQQYLWDFNNGPAANSGNQGCLIVTPSSGTVQYYQANNGANIIAPTGSTPFATGQWYFIALVRSGTGANNITMARDGVAYVTGTRTGLLGALDGVGIKYSVLGNYGGGGGIGVIGHMQDYRITKGVARSLSVPTAAFPTS